MNCPELCRTQLQKLIRTTNPIERQTRRRTWLKIPGEERRVKSAYQMKISRIFFVARSDADFVVLLSFFRGIIKIGLTFKDLKLNPNSEAIELEQSSGHGTCHSCV